MNYTKNMTTYIEEKSLNHDLVELTLLAIFSKNNDVTTKVDKLKDYILRIESRKGIKVNNFVKIHVFEEQYLLIALKELKKLNQLNAKPE